MNNGDHGRKQAAYTIREAFARAHNRLGQLYEARRDTAKAIRDYEKFVELWKNADPSLQPMVAVARSRLSALR